MRVGWRTLGRHQVGGFVAGAVDFGVMILAVEALHLSPVAGTALGAALGAVTNFTLSRAWIFRHPRGRPGWQAVRYALVSATSAGLNTLGEHLVHDVARVEYVIARALVAVTVSVTWNFPMHRRFVFRDEGGKG
ncbi:MAG TPA: GtrA family protein [Polyangiaceae bacterium]|jgi:putative flippase GtrA